MRDIIPCISCASCAIGYEAGFVGREVMLCQVSGREVGPDDGCTMGEPGVPAPAGYSYDVCVGDHAAVYGCHE